jgi:hypothetical protein
VNTELQLGDLAELVLVSGEASTVDAQRVTQAAVFSKTLLENLPSASRTPQSFVAFVPEWWEGSTRTPAAEFAVDPRRPHPGSGLRIDGFSDTGAGTPGGTGLHLL